MRRRLLPCAALTRLARPAPRRATLVALVGAAIALGPAGCAIGPGGVPGEPVAPPPVALAWRPGEAMALLLRPPADGARPIDHAHLEKTRVWTDRIAAIEAARPTGRRLDRRDRGGRRTWYFDGPEAILLRIDVDEDGSIDQSQYFGPEGLFAIVHRFAAGRRTQRIYWPPGRPRIVEVRDNLPPFPGVWWRSEENPFEVDEGPFPADRPAPDPAES